MYKLKRMAGYYHAVKNYLHTPKGRHDAVDCAQAIAVIAAVILAAGCVIKIMTRL